MKTFVLVWMMVTTICAESMSDANDLEERIFSKCASKSELQKLTDGVEKLANMVRYFVIVKLIPRQSQCKINLSCP